ncbi:hypothetical protein ACIBK8_02005 [Streptomyces sp. NPDC050161]|uniref:hypothetical protein n=1 Tax=Streptomyces sp. NPDC050161 TaxID=3365604 RepID=UPI0037B07315
MVLILVLSGGFAYMGLLQTGTIGRHGTFTVAECHLDFTHHYGSGKRGSSSTSTSEKRNCTGTFRSDDGETIFDNADMDFRKEETYPKGHTFTVQQSSGTLTPLNPGGATRTFCYASACLLVIAVVLFWTRTRLDKNGMSLKDTWRSTKGTATRASVVTLATVAVIGAALSPVLTAALIG